jgi:hypothetical protein
VKPAAFVVTFTAARSIDGIKALRATLKFALRRGLRCVDAQQLPSGVGAGGGGRTLKVRRNGEMNMPSAGKFLGRVFLKLADVKANGPLRLFTVEATEGQYGKLDLEFDDHTVLPLNVTNTRVMARAYGDDYGEWGGKEVELSVGETTFEGEPTETTILKPISPATPKKPPKPKGARGDGMDDEMPFRRRRTTMEMNKNLLAAFIELVQASYERDFVAENGGEPKPEERVFDAVRNILDEICAAPELASLHDWARSLREGQGEEAA